METSKARVITDVTNAVLKDIDVKSLIKEVFEILEREGFWKLYVQNLKLERKCAKYGCTSTDYDALYAIFKKAKSIYRLCIRNVRDFIEKIEPISRYKEFISPWVVLGNIQLYFLLTKEKKNKDLVIFLRSILNTRSPFYVSAMKEEIVRRSVKNALVYEINGSYLALKWFYSDKTKHLYTKNLLEQIKQYEEFELKNRLNIKSIKDSLRRARNLHVW